MSGLLNRLLGGTAEGEGVTDDTVTPIHVTDDDFEAMVLNSEVPVVVDFWAPWCAPCRMVAPALEKIATEFGEQALVVKVNTDENPRWANHYGVRGIPTLLFIWQGHEAGRIVGVVPAAAIRQQLEQMLGGASPERSGRPTRDRSAP